MRKSKTPEDSVKLGRILDFLERFRLAYNSKDSIYLEKVYSDDALIIVGTVLTENKNKDYHAPAYTGKIKLTQYTKREYLDNLKRTAFTKKSFLNVQLGDIKIIQHDNPRLTHIYGVSCVQQWNSSSYSDKGYLFLMMDFRNIAEPIIHVRTWQPTGYEDNQIGRAHV